MRVYIFASGDTFSNVRGIFIGSCAYKDELAQHEETAVYEKDHETVWLPCKATSRIASIFSEIQRFVQIHLSLYLLFLIRITPIIIPASTHSE